MAPGIPEMKSKKMRTKELTSLSNKNGILRKLNKNTIKDSISNCWIWNGTLNGPNGYGIIRLWKFSPKFYIHRLSAYIHLDYDLESKLQINHKRECKNRMCWNPDHLYIGTQYENVQDKMATTVYTNQNTFKTHCKYGHEFTKENTRLYEGERICKTCINERKDKME